MRTVNQSFYNTIPESIPDPGCRRRTDSIPLISGKYLINRLPNSNNGKSTGNQRESCCKKKSRKSGCLWGCSYHCQFQQHHYQSYQQKRPVISWSSAGKMGFKGSKKNTPYAAQMASADAAKTALDAGLKRVDVYVKGPVQEGKAPSAPWRIMALKW